MSFAVPEKFRVLIGPFGTLSKDGNNGMFRVQIRDKVFKVIASDGMDWEHVSVSRPDRCPTWEEMCAIKDMFWGEDDVVVQYHPRKADYVNAHPFCLHLWRPTKLEVPTPPPIMVGPLGAANAT